jgi:hypothetical protein
MPLDTHTLFTVATCIAGLLGLFLVAVWLQERSVRALAWWGAAYLMGAVEKQMHIDDIAAAILDAAY